MNWLYDLVHSAMWQSNIQDEGGARDSMAYEIILQGLKEHLGEGVIENGQNGQECP